MAISNNSSTVRVGRFLTKQTVAIVVTAAFLLTAPLYIYPVLLMKVMCFALFASAFNLLLGFGGLLSFGHAAFFGGAAYLTAHAVKVWGWSPEFGILFGTAGAAVLALVVGLLAIRRQGIYFAMITLALAQLFYFVCVQAPFTFGEDGIQGVPRGLLFGFIDLANESTMYLFVLTVFLAGIFAVYRFLNSPFGMVLKSVRENEQRAISLGYSVDTYKLVAFVFSGAIAGLAGGTKALVFQLATLTDVSWHTSGDVVLMTLLGGIGSICGPIVGAAVFVGLQNYLAESGIPVNVVIGSIFMVCVLVFRRGIVGEIGVRMRKRISRRAFASSN